MEEDYRKYENGFRRIFFAGYGMRKQNIIRTLYKLQGNKFLRFISGLPHFIVFRYTSKTTSLVDKPFLFKTMFMSTRFFTNLKRTGIQNDACLKQTKRWKKAGLLTLFLLLSLKTVFAGTSGSGFIVYEKGENNTEQSTTNTGTSVYLTKPNSATLPAHLVSVHSETKPGGTAPEKENGNPQDSTSLLLKEITVSAGIKNTRLSPLRLKNVDAATIQVKAPGRTFPELLKDIPGIFATSETGSYGDAKINIRGFKQENISVLLNGTPISGLTSGSMFWNNWLGLTDATATIQVQKGIGGSMLSDNSVGGTINIITKSPLSGQSGEAGYSYTNYGLSKAHISYNSGELKKGWAFSLMGSYTWGHGYVECTDVNSGAYMLSISKKIDNRHSLLFTALGAPEKHQQQSQRLSYAEIEQYGAAYSKNWGYYTTPQGKTVQKTISENTYFKPYFTLNHFYSNNKNLTINSAVYLTTGNGGGIWTESKGKRIIAYQKEGHIDWGSVISDNMQQSSDTPSKEGGSQNILSDFMAGHTQFGIKSTFIYEITEKLNLEGGLHYQHYRTWEKEQITDLLGGAYWYEDYQNNSLAGEAGRDPYKQVGDYIRTHNGKHLNYGTLYGMLHYRGSRWVFNVGASLNGSTHQRWDKYNYTGNNIYSNVATGIGGSIKAGALLKASTRSSFYLNGAFYSRVPYSSVYFASGNNRISEGIKNEKNVLGELGYRYVYDKGGIEATFYTAYWINKSLMSNPYRPLEEDAYKFMITGLNALHYGIEIDAFHNFTRWLKANAYASIGSWRWKNNVNATIYDPYTGQVESEIHVYSNGLPVGDAPQTQIGAGAQAKPFRHLAGKSRNWIGEFSISINWQYNTRYWADFEPNTRTNPDDTSNPYRIPAYHLTDISLGNTFTLKSTELHLFFNLNNVFNASYITRGKDGAQHTKETFTGYWGERRNCNFGIRIRF